VTDVILNCGLGAPTHQPDIVSPEWRHKWFFTVIPNAIKVQSVRLVKGDTEDTLVFYGRLLHEHSVIALAQYAALANQDCIAVYYPDADTGVLVGPNHVEWGVFNKEYFIK
jgi:hypothetical protein